jgi:hypothetical protein
MLHTKLIGRIALALSLVIFSGMNLAANAAPQEAACLPLLNLLHNRSSSPTVPSHVVASLPLAKAW